MMRFTEFAFVMLLSALFLRAADGQQVSPPSAVGWLAGPFATADPSAQAVSGTDLGWTFEHRGELFILFGDSWSDRTVCAGAATNDDAQGTLPLDLPAGVPEITFSTRAAAPLDFDPIRLYRNGESLRMAGLEVPVAGFSDGTDAFAVFSRSEYLACTRTSSPEPATCPSPPNAPADPFTCVETLAQCAPPIVPLLCDRATNSGCLSFQQCGQSTDGYCVDLTSSQHVGSRATEPFAGANRVDIGRQRPTDPVAYDSIAVWDTNKFLNVTARTVAAFTGTSDGNDYRPGHDALFMWGRPGFWAEGDREARVYLMMHPLPFRSDFEPQYFGGVDAVTGEPRWTALQSEALPLAMDGRIGGDPREDLPIVGQMAISWIPAPVNKWIMLYAGDVPDFFLTNPANARPGPDPASIRIRFADHPWGPWTPARAHLIPGSPATVNNLYGPGGIMFHNSCRDQNGSICAPSTIPVCITNGLVLIGRLYAPNVIDSYTRADGTGGITIYWNVSTYNPYGVMLMRTTVRPDTACNGDCDGDGQASVNEIVKLVNIVLGTAQPSACWQGVPSNRAIDVSLIVSAVRNVLLGCDG